MNNRHTRSVLLSPVLVATLAAILPVILAIRKVCLRVPLSVSFCQLQADNRCQNRAQTIQGQIEPNTVSAEASTLLPASAEPSDSSHLLCSSAVALIKEHPIDWIHSTCRRLLALEIGLPVKQDMAWEKPDANRYQPLFLLITDLDLSLLILNL